MPEGILDRLVLSRDDIAALGQEGRAMLTHLEQWFDALARAKKLRIRLVDGAIEIELVDR